MKPIIIVGAVRQELPAAVGRSRQQNRFRRLSDSSVVLD
jgi:hypothetical protein